MTATRTRRTTGPFVLRHFEGRGSKTRGILAPTDRAKAMAARQHGASHAVVTDMLAERG